jgi:C4-dicarboxylate transporter DctM subunit
VIFPVAYAMKIDPVALGIMLTLNIEMGVVTPPVGLNLFAVSGTSRIPLPQVLKGTIPFFLGDLAVLLLVIFFPALATWLPSQLITSHFK